MHPKNIRRKRGRVEEKVIEASEDGTNQNWKREYSWVLELYLIQSTIMDLLCYLSFG